jgi:hypothetical protein
VEFDSTSTRETLRAEFERALEMRAARRALVDVLRAILAVRQPVPPTLLSKPDRRRLPRDT